MIHFLWTPVSQPCLHKIPAVRGAEALNAARGGTLQHNSQGDTVSQEQSRIAAAFILTQTITTAALLTLTSTEDHG